MKQDEMSFRPSLNVTFTAEEIEILETCCATHYDRKCIAAGRQGGLVFEMKNSDGTTTLSSTELDLLAKITEAPPRAIAEKTDLLSVEISKAFQLLNISIPPAIAVPESQDMEDSLAYKVKSGVLPQMISETDAPNEPIQEVLICESISGG